MCVFVLESCDQEIHIFRINLAKIPKNLSVQLYNDPRMPCDQESGIFQTWKLILDEILEISILKKPKRWYRCGTATIYLPNPGWRWESCDWLLGMNGFRSREKGGVHIWKSSTKVT